ncbi:hypothetical protein AB0O28_20175 [Microbispora sp. NPDC088329]|uniref:hypothetical protein n=1 Tax=Microbispora sp. NPDC088329 TaxID=3154869 RepID=UPI003441D0E1
MRMNPPAGNVTLDPGQGMAWVDEHGAHLVDYAACHLESAPMLTAVIAALESCAARERPENVSDRAWLLSALRRECATGPGRGFLPASGPGGPDQGAVRRAWNLADPLGAETLRLLYRHELPLRDLVYVLALPLKEAGRLIARTQDVVEILVSGLDGLARGRPICPELGPLAAAVFPDGHGDAADFGAARTALLRHIVTCVVCKRPINIRYTVPQILSRPPVADLADETRQRLLDALNRTRPARAERAAHRPPSSFGMPLAAPVNTASAPAAPAPPPAVPRESRGHPAVPAQGSPQPSVPSPRTVPPAPRTPPVPPLVPPDSGLSLPAPRAESATPSRQDRADKKDTSSGVSAGGGPERPEPPARAISQEDTQPSLPWPSGTSRSRGTRRPAPSPGPSAHAAPEATAPSLPPGQDTPLYNALLSQIRAREALAHAAEAVPAADVADAPGEADLPHRPLAGTQIRIVEILARVGSLLRATALRIVIVVVAGAAGTVMGINLFAPSPQSQKGSLEAGVAQASADPARTADNPSAAGATGGAAAGDAAEGRASGAPQVTVTATAAAGGAAQTNGQGVTPDVSASPGAFLMGAWGVQAPSVITLDAFGRGTLSLSTTSGKPVKWRISAPGLLVEPSSGTLKPGHTDVLTVRALRVRYWCGVPSPVTAPLELHGPKGDGTATVRWSSC